MFYHLTGSALEDTAARLLSRAVQEGWRAMLRGTDNDRLDNLDGRLWEVPHDSFLPHGRAGGGDDGAHPVLLGTGAVPTGAHALMAIDGAEVSVEEAMTLERVWILFDGQDPAAVDTARGQWRQLTAAGIPAQYWSEKDGHWTRKAVS